MFEACGYLECITYGDVGFRWVCSCLRYVAALCMWLLEVCGFLMYVAA